MVAAHIVSLFLTLTHLPPSHPPPLSCHDALNWLIVVLLLFFLSLSCFSHCKASRLAAGDRIIRDFSQFFPRFNREILPEFW